MKYVFREGRKPKGVKADAAAAELERIYATHGALQPSVIVEESKPKDAPLHPAFEWRDNVAAEEYRLFQARNIVRCVHVIEEGEKKAAPVFVHVRVQHDEDEPTKREGEYHPVSVVVQNVDLFERALSELEQRMCGAMASVEALRSAAEKSDDSYRLARVALAVRALETASDAIRALH